MWSTGTSDLRYPVNPQGVPRSKQVNTSKPRQPYTAQKQHLCPVFQRKLWATRWQCLGLKSPKETPQYRAQMDLNPGHLPDPRKVSLIAAGEGSQPEPLTCELLSTAREGHQKLPHNTYND